MGARVVRLRQGQSAAESETWIRTARGDREDEAAAAAQGEADAAQSVCAVPHSLL